MTDGLVIELYTLPALAKAEKVSGGHLRRVMMEVREGKTTAWRGWRFRAFGSGNRATWIAYRGDYEVVVNN